MATHTGSAGVVKVGTNTVAEVRNWTVDQSQDTVETTKLGDTVKTYKTTLSDSTGTIDCFWDETDTYRTRRDDNWCNSYFKFIS